MKGLAYIPTKKDKQELNMLLCEQKNQTQSQTLNNKQVKQMSQKKISQADLQILLQRLTKQTKKQYQCQQQITHIMTANKQLLKKRIQGQKVQNRLIAYGREREKKIQDLANQLQKQQRNYYFRQIPKICQKSHKIKQLPIDRRFQDLMKQKQIKLQVQKEKYKPTFRPTVDPHSEFINEIENLGDLYNRMKVKQLQAQKRKNSISKKIQKQEKQILTFKPIINEKSRYIAENICNRVTPGASSQIVDNIQEEFEVYPFAPTINKNTNKFLQGKEFDKNCFKRLYNNARELSLKNSLKREQNERAHTFHPSMNKKSLQIVSQIKNTVKNNDLQSQKFQAGVQEIKIGNQVQLVRAGKSYSMRSSSGIKHSWYDDQQSNTTRPSNLKKFLKLKLLR